MNCERISVLNHDYVKEALDNLDCDVKECNCEKLMKFDQQVHDHLGSDDKLDLLIWEESKKLLKESE